MDGGLSYNFFLKNAEVGGLKPEARYCIMSQYYILASVRIIELSQIIDVLNFLQFSLKVYF